MFWGYPAGRPAVVRTRPLYSVSQKTSPTFLAVTRESIGGFS